MKNILKVPFLIVIAFCLLIQSCDWFKETPEIGLVLAKHFDNKLYKKFDTAVYNKVFMGRLEAWKTELTNPLTLKSYYESIQQQPAFVTRFYVNGGLDTLKSYIGKSREHGFNPEIFGLKDLGRLLSELDANKFKTVEELYPVLADLEIRSAESALKYHNFIYFGSINPRGLLSRYYIKVKRPDSNSIKKVLDIKDLAALLSAIQPKSSQYEALQAALAVYEGATVKDEQAIKTVKINLERLRWKLPETGPVYVQVNIPDFSLVWMNEADTLIQMKVCVGGKREQDYQAKIATFLKTGNLDDKPKNHETPILFSKLNAIQVNPIWNIPASIAQSEIYYQALKDPYYLSNNNMRVYHKGKLVNDPDTIQWAKYPRQKLPFQFKQGAGDGNAMGKFKFMFESGTSIYLHDTNNKYAFNLKNRAISHGCVRVEKPLEFAELLLGDKFQYDKLRMEINLPPLDTTKMIIYQKKLAQKADTVNVFQLKPKWFSVKPTVSLLINYNTAWFQNGHMEFRPDIYGLDEILWSKLQKFL